VAGNGFPELGLRRQTAATEAGSCCGPSRRIVIRRRRTSGPKIISKMNTATALGTVIVGLTTFLLQDALQKEPSAWHWLAFAAFGASAALYFSALFLYDTLQMPT
jgi:hypothetical protein